MVEATSCGGVVIFRGKILLLYKNYKNKYEGWVLPKGTVEEGEEYNQTALREVKEEIGQDVNEVQFIKSYPYEAKEMLMLGFKAKVNKKEFDLSGEVSLATWVPFAEALGKLREGSIAWQLVKEVIEK